MTGDSWSTSPTGCGYAKDAPPLDFDRDGAQIVRGVFDPSGMDDALWNALSSRHGIRRDDRATWTPGGFGKLTRFGKSGPFASVATEALGEEISAVLGPGWHEIARWGQPLVTFPMPGPWDVPQAHWHIDMPCETPIPALRMFAYVSAVAAGGGGTLIVTGSHKLAERHLGVKSADFKRHLADVSPWCRGLWRPEPGEDRIGTYMVDGTEVEGVPLRVVELCAEPGDVVLWHPSLLHTIAPNCSEQPRFMLTHTAYRASAP